MPAMPFHRVLAFILALAATPALAAVPGAGDIVRGDLLEATIAGEFALQAGKLDEAAKWYLQAATAADGDAGLARRAASIALLSGDETGAAAALRLWRERDPASLALHSAEMVLALRISVEATARDRLASLLAAPGTEGWQRALGAMDGGRDPELAAKLLGEAVEENRIPDQLQAWLA